MTGSVPEVPPPSQDAHGAPSFQIGDLLKRAGSSGTEAQAVVLDKADDSGRLLLMSLPAGEISEASAEEAASWTAAPMPQARWVEVYELDAPSPFFAAYVPDIHSAIAVYRAFEARDGDFKVEIYTNDERENEKLDEIGYADVGLHPSPR
jgi:hypothetical protein